MIDKPGERERGKEGGRERGRGKGSEKCHWLCRKGLALFKMACVRERERGRGKGEGKVPLAVQNQMIDKPGERERGKEGGRERGRGRGREKCHWLSRKGLALFKLACVREREREGEGRGRDVIITFYCLSQGEIRHIFPVSVHFIKFGLQFKVQFFHLF